eukprot:TRINITY_DN15152_c0_g1_i1.p1 TRINITY_DN15152_c0_g1~~TRINITY_DN15152_c0_g1_i1.p1  ORF type:complete len:736 (+),score=147.87 TRINITY_DN15152_c0_g1_i1:43-2250(+)
MAHSIYSGPCRDWRRAPKVRCAGAALVWAGVISLLLSSLSLLGCTFSRCASLGSVAFGHLPFRVESRRRSLRRRGVIALRQKPMHCPDLAVIDPESTKFLELDDAGMHIVDPRFPPLQNATLEDVMVRTGFGKLDAEQYGAVKAALNNQSILLTGGAGVGKTYTCAAIRAALEWKYGERHDEVVAVTASTGTAALLVEGCTLHSMMGAGVPTCTKDFKKIKMRKKDIWKPLEVLIIDEASMVSGEMFDRLDEQLREIKGCPEKPFGGMQVILVGDLFQLAPIENRLPKRQEAELDSAALEENRAVMKIDGKPVELFLNRGMIFQSTAFWALKPYIVELQTQHRQHHDGLLGRHLASLRDGSGDTAASIRWLNVNCYRGSSGSEDEDDDDCYDAYDDHESPPLYLVSTNKQADDVNQKRLAQLEGPITQYKAKDRAEPFVSVEEKSSVDFDEERLKAFKAKRKRHLMKGEFFMDNSSSCPVSKVLDLKVGTIVMLTANLDVEEGLVNGARGHVKLLGKGRVLVEFAGQRQHWIMPHEHKSRYPGLGHVCRIQLPLRLAWAITHHRAQGKTIENVVVDPGSFSQGQAYVALSRVGKASDMVLSQELRKQDIRVNQASKEMYSKLRSASYEAARQAVGTWRDISPVSQKQWVPTTASAAVAKQKQKIAAQAKGNEKLTFGKFKGRKFECMIEKQKFYCLWCLEQTVDPTPAMRHFQDYLRVHLKEVTKGLNGRKSNRL